MMMKQLSQWIQNQWSFCYSSQAQAVMLRRRRPCSGSPHVEQEGLEKVGMSSAIQTVQVEVWGGAESTWSWGNLDEFVAMHLKMYDSQSWRAKNNCKVDSCIACWGLKIIRQGLLLWVEIVSELLQSLRISKLSLILLWWAQFSCFDYQQGAGCSLFINKDTIQ